MPALPAADLDHVLRQTDRLWADVAGRRVFITGGTGFFGRWALESFVAANDRLRLNAEAVVLTRRAEAFRRAEPHVGTHPAVRLVDGDVRSFELSPEPFAAILHMATDADVGLIDRKPSLIIDTIVNGTRRVLDYAQACGTPRLLHTSSGAVYGRQPPELRHLPEEFPGAPVLSAPRAAYAEAKRLAEVMCLLAVRDAGIGAVNARCFAFVGPLLPTGRGYAIGNFFGDAVARRPIRIAGDGTPVRSYLYAADLAIWLWTLALRGTPGRAYNVGSETEVSIGDAARAVSRAFDLPPPIAGAVAPPPGCLPERYVPSTARARDELGLLTWIEFPEAVTRTADWLRAQDPS